MSAKTISSKKKESSKNAVSQFLRSTDDEIKAELEAMTNLEYNLHSDYDAMDITPELPLFTVRKVRNPNLKEPVKQEKLSAEKSKTEKFEVESQIQTYVPNASVDELQSVLRQPALSSEDKYKILDARDRLMRIKQSRTQQLSMAKITRGTCPDMCPEKERLMRESQRQVAPYELLEGAEYRIDHEIAVKQYSRSSADQEEPLPQDLRPVESLKMTMSYLLHEIVDLCEETGTNLAEWYHFLWDRTRGIRKDITQQELCCRDSVELVEQCARFHIVCAERLCAEQVSVFDKKINTENLTKCLQTLKYMYHDLRVKGITCKNEAEFRAYIILLNLNNGNFIWDVQQLPTSIQKSPEVRFAIQVYSSIESNNYAKFFRLVRHTSYLNTCILLRYFNQVRVKALSVMVKAYCRTTSTAFPLYELIDILGFQDENEAIYFCEQLGLNVSSDELDIMLNRQNFSQPMSNIEQGRSCNIVEFERLRSNCTIGQCIAGEKMPEKLYKGHKPHNSFDAQGFLKPEAVNAEDQNSKKNIKGIDPFDYMDQDIPEIEQKIPTSQPESKKSLSERRKQDTSQNFKIPKVLINKNVFTNTANFVKQASLSVTKKSEDSSPFCSGATTQKSLKRGIDSMNDLERRKEGEGKLLEVFQSPAPVKRLRDEDSLPFGSPQAASSIFGNASRASGSIFANASNRTASAFGEHGEATPGSFGAGIFGKAMTAGQNIFGNVTATTSSSIFASSSHTDKFPTNLWPSGNSSIFSNRQNYSKLPKEKQIDPIETANISQDKLECQTQKSQLSNIERDSIKQKLDSNSEEILTEIENEIILELCSSILKQELEKTTLYETLSEKLTKELLEELIIETSSSILKQELKIQEKLQELSNRTQKRIILKYYKIWRQFTVRKQNQRSALDETPVWLQKQSVSDCAKSLFSKNQPLAIKNMRRTRRKRSKMSPNLEYLDPIESKIYEGLKANAKALEMEISPNTYWKLMISWPHLDNRPILWRHKKIMNQYLCPSDYTMEPIMKCYKPNPYETLNICIKHFEGFISHRHLIGADSLLFIATSAEDPKYIVKRLINTILSREKLMPIPVMVVILEEDNIAARKIKINRELEEFVESGYISEYFVRYEEILDEKMILNLIQNAAVWLTINKSPPIPLEMDFLSRIVESCLAEELWLRILGHASFNRHLQTATKDVNFVIDLHNEAVNHLIDIVLDPEALNYTDFPPEFRGFLPRDVDLPCGYEYFDSTWRKKENRQLLQRIFNDFLLPKWTFSWPISSAAELKDLIIRYSQRVLPPSSYNTITSKISSNILFSPIDSNESIFIQVLIEILKEKIKLIGEPKPRVVYNKNHIKHFRTLPWWFKSTTLTNYPVKNVVALSRSDSFVLVEPTEEIKADEGIEDIVKEYQSIYDEPNATETSALCREARKQASEIRLASETLERTLAEQKSRSRTLEEKLKAALNEIDDQDISIS